MSQRLTGAALIVSVLTAPSVWADGLLYQLPDDGAWARFELQITDNNASSRKVEVIMRSVGRMASEPPARWLEFKVPSEDETRTLKLLIPERYLKEGEQPIEHIIRAWRKDSEAIPVSVPRMRDFWMLVFLAGPLRDVKTLDSKSIETPLGALECPGLVGQSHVREDDGYEEDLTYTVRRHAKAPFGVVACDIDCVVTKDGKLHGKVKYELKLVEVGKDAVSELRGYE
jgi:hypothetical protein